MSEPSVDDQLTRALARALREREQARREAWEPVLLGLRSAEVVARERADAGDTAEEIELARALHEPSPKSEDARLLELMRTSRSQPAAKVVDIGPPAATGRGRWRAAAVVVLAAAAVATFVWWQASPEPRREDQATIAMLPDYELSTDSGHARVRGPEPEPEDALRYRIDNGFEWLLRPRIEVGDAVDVRVCARSGHAELVAIDTASIAEVSRSGSIRLSGPIRALGLEPGRWTITLVVASPGALPEAGAETCAAETGVGRHVERLLIEIDD